ncbi:MAG: hypothetical protein ACRD00_00635 [Thermoanaerobaculia bacterium]
MSETEADRAYYAAGEAAFIRRRGTPFLLSPKDFALLKQWRALGIPIEAVEKGIDEAFARRQERQAAGRVNALSYCRDAVLVAWERAAEAAAGKGSGREPESVDTATGLRVLADALSTVAQRRPDLAGPLEAARRCLDRQASSGRSAGEIEASLARADKKLANELREAMPDPERAAMDAAVRGLLEKARVRLDDAAAERTARALSRRAVRERLALPRLTLL